MASLNHGISCPFKVGQEQASVQQQHSPSLPSIAPGVTEKTGAPVPYQLALQMPRHPPQEETIRLVVHPHSITETRRNSSNKRKKSHKTMQPGCLLAIGACSCRGGREGGPVPIPVPRPDGQQLSQVQLWTRDSRRTFKVNLRREKRAKVSPPHTCPSHVARAVCAQQDGFSRD